MENGLSHVGARWGGRTITDLNQLRTQSGQGIRGDGWGIGDDGS